MDRIAALGLSLELDDAATHQELARLIAARDADAAYRLAHELLTRVVDATSPQE
jgi:DNA-binding FadR family transcriptional regulator